MFVCVDTNAILIVHYKMGQCPDQPSNKDLGSVVASSRLACHFEKVGSLQCDPDRNFDCEF